MKSVIKAAVADGFLTFVWIISASCLGIGIALLSSALGVVQGGLPSLAIATSLVFPFVLIFGLLADLLGGASFNPTMTAAFCAAGLGGADSLLSAAVRVPAQMVGAVGGVLAILEVIPEPYKHMLAGPSLKVDLHIGAVAEGILTFVFTFGVFLIFIRGPFNIFVKNWLLALSSVVIMVAGSSYTGPSMNPVNAYGWAYIENKHNTWEQLYVYWIPPFIGAILAARAFLTLLPPPVKEKKA